MEEYRIKYLISMYGLHQAKLKCIEYGLAYMMLILHPDKKMSIYFDKFRQSVDEFLVFVETM